MMAQSISKLDIAASFGKAAGSYDSVAHFQRWVADQLLALAEKKVCAESKPEVVLDLGCGTGYIASSLTKCFPGATYLGLDLSEGMARQARSNHDDLSSLWLAGDAESLPFKNDSIDLIYSSLAIQWCADLPKLFSEIKRVLKPQGTFVFSTLLDGTLTELKQAWAHVDQAQRHVNEFAFLEDYQEAVSEAGLIAEILSEDKKILEYQQVKELTRELKLLGAHNITSDRPKKMTGKARLRAFLTAYEAFRRPDGILPASYQVLFGKVNKS